MSDGIDIRATVVGDEQIRKAFLDFQSDVRSRLRRALMDGGQIIADAAAARAPRLSGDLAGSISPKLVESDSKMTVIVAPRGKHGSFVGRLMEFGVVNHGTRNNITSAGVGLKARGGKRARARRVSELRAAGQYRIAPHPFMEPAGAATLDRASELVTEAVGVAVAEVER